MKTHLPDEGPIPIEAFVAACAEIEDSFVEGFARPLVSGPREPMAATVAEWKGEAERLEAETRRLAPGMKVPRKLQEKLGQAKFNLRVLKRVNELLEQEGAR